MINNIKSPGQYFSDVNSLIGERSRAIMLWTLLDGRAYTATELALCADISPQAASNHLSKLMAANLLAADIQGRHKYYRFANDKAAHTIEMIAGLLPIVNDADKNNFIVTGIKHARTCYDHLAGKTGVLVTLAMLDKKILLHKKNNYEVSPIGIKWFALLNIDIEKVQQTKRKFAYPCLDWSERKHHLAGALGAAFFDAVAKKDWVRKVKHSRELIISGTGKTEFQKRLGVEL